MWTLALFRQQLFRAPPAAFSGCIRNFATARPSATTSTTSKNAAAAAPKTVPSSSSGNEYSSLEGRYAVALFNVAKSNNLLPAVYDDLRVLSESLTANKKIEVSMHFVGTGNSGAKKASESSASGAEDLLAFFKDKAHWQPLSVNFIQLLFTNGRFLQFRPIFNSFQKLYRSHFGLKYCLVTTSQALTEEKKNGLLAALKKRMGEGVQLIVEFNVSKSILGGMVVQMEDSVLDFSVSSMLDRCQGRMLEPLQ